MRNNQTLDTWQRQFEILRCATGNLPREGITLRGQYASAVIGGPAGAVGLALAIARHQQYGTPGEQNCCRSKTIGVAEYKYESKL